MHCYGKLAAMKILTVDIGTGTQDIYLYNSNLDMENNLHQEIAQLAAKIQALIEKDLIAPHVAYEVAPNVEELKMLMKGRIVNAISARSRTRPAQSSLRGALIVPSPGSATGSG